MLAMLPAILAHAQWQQTSLNNLSVLSLTALGGNIFAGTYGGGVYVSSNDGATWTQSNNGLTNLNVRGLAVHGNLVYAGTESGAFVSGDTGATWVNISNGLAGIYAIYDFVFLGSTDIVIGTQSNVFKTTDSGASWFYSGAGIPSGTSNIQSLAGNGTALFAGSQNNGGVYYSADSAANWSSVGLNTHTIYALGMNGNDLFAGTPDTIFYSNNNGSSWIPIENGIGALNHWTLCFTFDGSRVIAGTRGGGVYFSDNNGTLWAFAGSGLPLGSYVNKLVISGNSIFAGTDFQQGVWKRPLAQLTTSIDENDLAVRCSVIPNPSKGKFKLHLTGGEHIDHVNIFTILGEKVFEKNIAFPAAEDINIDLTAQSKGIYLLRVSGVSGRQHSEKIVIE